MLRGNAFELVLATVVKDLVCADDEIPHRAAHEHLARPGEAAYARTHVNREAADVAIVE